MPVSRRSKGEHSRRVGKVKRNQERQKRSTASLMRCHPLNRLRRARETKGSLEAQRGAMDPGLSARVISYRGNKTSFDSHYSPRQPLQGCCQTRVGTDLPLCKLSYKYEFINYEPLSPSEHSSGTGVGVCASQSHPSTNTHKEESSGTRIYKLSKHYSVTNDYVLGNYFKAI